ncbi:MAG: copper chaperone PCu(A)C [Burkholderiales bacterium]|nr:copper chaperone PCu(A)C [Burkholderiales bacterium]MDP2399679.1 copper chaperone PCu(A)C [Burkholderiales bacterium]
MFHRNLLKSAGLLLALLFAAAAQAQTVTVRDAWIRGTVQGQSATGAFMELSAKTDARLVAASSPVAKVTEVHNMRMENGVMRMFPVAGIDIPAGKSVKLASGGYHVMLMQLDKPLTPGDRVPLLLTFELADKKREAVELSVEVRDLKGQPKKSHQHH